MDEVQTAVDEVQAAVIGIQAALIQRLQVRREVAARPRTAQRTEREGLGVCKGRSASSPKPQRDKKEGVRLIHSPGKPINLRADSVEPPCLATWMIEHSACQLLLRQSSLIKYSRLLRKRPNQDSMLVLLSRDWAAPMRLAKIPIVGKLTLCHSSQSTWTQKLSGRWNSPPVANRFHCRAGLGNT